MSSPAPDPASQQPLSDADLDALGALLAADWAPETTMDLEQLDGFLAGLICAPRVMLPSTYMPAIFGDGEPEFPDMDTAQRFFGLLMRRHNQIAAALNAPVERLDDPRAYVPLLIDWQANEDVAQQMVEDGEIPRLPRYGELWARGFLHAVHLARDDWDDMPADDEEGAQLVDDAVIAAYDLRDYWRDVQFESIRVKEPIRREPKVGRNDPCPCGSGRKFKQCHGREQ
jgi:uncharacterized protein